MEIIKHKDKFYMKVEGGYREILATTDTSLKYRMTCVQCDGNKETTFSGTYNSQKKCDLCNGEGSYMMSSKLPQPSQQFIEQYVESYNVGLPITEVLVEYQCLIAKGSLVLQKEGIKVNPDNTINIKYKMTCVQCDGTGETTFSGTYNSQRKCDLCDGKGSYLMGSNSSQSINIKSTKDFYTREEVLELFKKCSEEFHGYSDIRREDILEWITKNL